MSPEEAAAWAREVAQAVAAVEPNELGAYLVEHLGQDGAARALGMEPWDGSRSWWYFSASETP